jgi:xanthine/uracil permease
MDKDTSLPVVSLVAIIVGTVILLYGVILDSGMEMNTPMIAGGMVMIIGIGILAFALGSIEQEGEEPT